MLDFLGKLDEADIKYVSWKNNHELFEAVTGNSDLDILVMPTCQVSFRILAQQNGWLELENPVAHFFAIRHFYKISATGKVFHLHVYFEVVTGESWLKEFILPLNAFLISERVMCPEYNIWILSNKAQAYIFLIRHFLKTGSLTSRFLYLHEIDSYKSEWLLCKTSADDLHGFGPIAIDPYITKSGLDKGFSTPSFSASIKFRLFLLQYCRFSIFSLPLLRLTSFLKRSLNKVVVKQKKRFLGGGMIIAISGADGAGKSSMISGLNQSFSSFQSCITYTLGKPQGKVLESIRLRMSSKMPPTKTVSADAEEVTIKRALASIILGFLRLRQARRARVDANNGNLVLVDRWPTNNFGKMDSPKILSHGDSPWLLRMMAQIEKKIYEKIPSADLCFYLNVSIETAVSRNESRVKVGKETKDEIVMRHVENANVFPICNKIIHFKNEGPFEEKFFELQSIVWHELIALKSKVKIV